MRYLKSSIFPSVISVLSHVTLDLLESDRRLDEIVLPFRLDLVTEFLDVDLSLGLGSERLV